LPRSRLRSKRFRLLLRLLRLLYLLRIILHPLHPWTLDQPQRSGIPMTHALLLQVLVHLVDRPWGATHGSPSTGSQVIQEGWTVVRKPGLLLLRKHSCSIRAELDAGIGPVEDEPVFELAQLSGPSPELEQGTGQVLLQDLLAGEHDGKGDLHQVRGRSV